MRLKLQIAHGFEYYLSAEVEGEYSPATLYSPPESPEMTETSILFEDKEVCISDMYKELLSVDYSAEECADLVIDAARDMLQMYDNLMDFEDVDTCYSDVQWPGWKEEMLRQMIGD